MEKEITIENLQQEVAELKTQVETLTAEKAKAEQNGKNYYEWYQVAERKYLRLRTKIGALVELISDELPDGAKASVPF